MLSKQDMSKLAQMGFFALEDLVPQDHLLRDKWISLLIFLLFMLS